MGPGQMSVDNYVFVHPYFIRPISQVLFSSRCPTTVHDAGRNEVAHAALDSPRTKLYGAGKKALLSDAKNRGCTNDWRACGQGGWRPSRLM